MAATDPETPFTFKFEDEPEQTVEELPEQLQPMAQEIARIMGSFGVEGISWAKGDDDGCD